MISSAMQFFLLLDVTENHGGEIMNQEIRTQVVIKVANLDPKVQRLLKAYEEFKAAANDLQVETWKECIEVHVE